MAGSTVDGLLRKLAADRRVTFDLTDAHAGDLMQRLGLGPGHAEGRFLPGTYLAEHRRAASNILREAHDRMRMALADAWHRRDKNLPYATRDEALVVASIVEKETARAADRPRVAGVFVRRMRLGMRLQADPTVIYGLGTGLDRPLRRTDLTRDHPHNTYTRDGLPPTPIALPRHASIAAALHPDNSSALYFVARTDGSSAFSDTLAEHNAAVARYRRRTAASTGG